MSTIDRIVGLIHPSGLEDVAAMWLGTNAIFIFPIKDGLRRVEAFRRDDRAKNRRQIYLGY